MKVSDDVIGEEEKRALKDVLIPEMMSSEDERFDGDDQRFFAIKKPSWRTNKYDKLVGIVDKAYETSSSKRSKEQMVRRMEASPSTRNPPKQLPYGHGKFIKE